jgi:hypothetical protein
MMICSSITQAITCHSRSVIHKLWDLSCTHSFSAEGNSAIAQLNDGYDPLSREPISKVGRYK